MTHMRHNDSPRAPPVNPVNVARVRRIKPVDRDSRRRTEHPLHAAKVVDRQLPPYPDINLRAAAAGDQVPVVAILQCSRSERSEEVMLDRDSVSRDSTPGNTVFAGLSPIPEFLDVMTDHS
jgi:hypothetical protein